MDKEIALVTAGGQTNNTSNDTDTCTAGHEANETNETTKYNEKTRILQPNEELMTREELQRKHACFYIIAYIILIGAFPALIVTTFYIVDEDDHERYFIQRLYNFAITLTIQYITGAFFKKYLDLKTAYTRKILHLVGFSLPLIIDAIANELTNATMDAMWATWQFQIWLGMFWTIPCRKYSNKLLGDPTIHSGCNSTNALTYFNFCELTIDALDRPEDRPNTLLWLQTQILLSYFFYIILAVIFQYDTESPMVLLIPVFIGGLGDGLAEPVGVKFGRNCFGRNCQYKTHGCCTKYDYTRSVPGSSMVLLSGYIGVAAAYNDFTMYQFIIAMIALPPLGTVVEAKAPHTMDNPFIVLIVGAASLGILYLPF